ncbi:MAG TPA: hypothetical protein VGK33_16700, partial [Chloroflexota bacterium]
MQLRVLCVQTQAGAEVVRGELQRAGYDLTAKRVQTEAGLRRALRTTEWDLIVVDHVQRGFSAVAALSVVQEHALDIPFLVIGDSIGEETAVDLMRAGVHDVINEDNLRRLRPAVERELREAERRIQHRNSDAALRESEER